MAGNIWIVSDTHFGHDNIIKFPKRDGTRYRPEFDSIAHMDEELIENWNSVVKVTDKVYHLGDVAFSARVFEKVLPRLVGKKRLIWGNHDKLDLALYARYFQKCRMWQRLEASDKLQLLLTHVPIHPSSLQRNGMMGINVHGHNHYDMVPLSTDAPGGMPHPHYFNVCVEHTNYTPVNVEDLFSRARRVLKDV